VTEVAAIVPPVFVRPCTTTASPGRIADLDTPTFLVTLVALES
jgi:hypothetical protein